MSDKDDKKKDVETDLRKPKIMQEWICHRTCFCPVEKGGLARYFNVGDKVLAYDKPSKHFSTKDEQYSDPERGELIVNLRKFGEEEDYILRLTTRQMKELYRHLLREKNIAMAAKI